MTRRWFLGHGLLLLFGAHEDWMGKVEKRIPRAESRPTKEA